MLVSSPSNPHTSLETEFISLKLKVDYMHASLKLLKASSCPDDISALQYKNSNTCTNWPPSTWPASPPMALPFLRPPSPMAQTPQPPYLPYTWTQHALFLFCLEGSFSQKSKSPTHFFFFTFSSNVSFFMKSSVLPQHYFLFVCLFEVSLPDETENVYRQGLCLVIYVS